MQTTCIKSMKVYFDGGSWTRGLQKDVVVEEESYPHQFCKTIGCDYDNVATKGGSNMKVVRHLLTEYKISDYDLAIFQFTQPTRLEWVKDGKWTCHKVTDRHVFWDHYYKEIYNDLYGQTMEQIHFETVRNTCNAYDIPCIIATTDPPNDYIKYDYYMKGKVPMNGSHPTGEGYKMIADDLVKLYENLL